MTNRTFFITAVTVTLAVAIVPFTQRPASSPLSAAFAQTPAQVWEDKAITKRIRAALDADAEVNMFAIRIQTILGEVRVTGSVNTQARADRVLYHVRTAGGVREVRNELFVKTAQ